MSRAQARAADISVCIHCFTACGKPCGAIGRASAVSCGVCLNGCRGAGWGLGNCLVGLLHGLVKLCAGIAQLLGFIVMVIAKLLIGLLAVIAQLWAVLLVVALVGTVGFLGYLYWDPIVHFFETVKNGTIEYYEKTREDPRVIELWNNTKEYYEVSKDKLVELGNQLELQKLANKTEQLYDDSKTHVIQAWYKKEEYYEASKDKLVELGNHPEVQRVGAKTAELYDAAKDQVGDAYEKVRQYEMVQSAVNGTIGFFNSIKSKFWG